MKCRPVITDGPCGESREGPDHAGRGLRGRQRAQHGGVRALQCDLLHLRGITSGFVFPFADADTAGKVATAGCGGTWAITPGVLEGKERVKFIGGQALPPPARPPASK